MIAFLLRLLHCTPKAFRESPSFGASAECVLRGIVRSAPLPRSGSALRSSTPESLLGKELSGHGRGGGVLGVVRQVVRQGMRELN